MSSKFFFACLALLAASILAPIGIAWRKARQRKRNLDYASEVAQHWPDLEVPRAVPEAPDEPQPEVMVLPAHKSTLERTIGLADLTRGEIPAHESSCTHPPDVRPRVTLLHGVRVEIGRDIPACADCVSGLLIRYGIGCVACAQLILPGDEIAAAPASAAAVLPRYEHLRVGCCDDLSRYCGVWGKGELIPLHALYPGAFPEANRLTLGYQPFSHRRREPGSA